MVAYELSGAIAGFGFSTGHRVVVGHWDASPIGPFCDLMWAEPDDHRTLIAHSERAADFITAVYSFDSTVIAPELVVTRTARRLAVRWTDGEIDLRLGRGLSFPPRPTWVTKRIEHPFAEALLGVKTTGVSPTGVVETYRAQRLQRIVSGWGVVAGNDLGDLQAPTPAARFGFTEPPPFPSVTTIRPLLEDPGGRLADVVERATS